MGTFRYGTSSWSEKSWVGPFYPAGTAPRDFLAHYARQFDTVEADVTYYRIPDRNLVAGWVHRTPEGFTLAAKFPRSIVHAGEGPVPDGRRVLVQGAVEEETRLFLETMRILGPRAGPLLLQFPYFRQEIFPEVGAFLARLDPYLATLPGSFRYAVEVRNRDWITPSLLQVLRRHRVALALTEVHTMPHPAEIARQLNVLTTDFLYVRLIGNRKQVDGLTSTFDRVVVDRSGSLRRWGQLLRGFLDRVPTIYAYANNHYAGHAPATIQTLRDQVLGSG